MKRHAFLALGSGLGLMAAATLALVLSLMPAGAALAHTVSAPVAAIAAHGEHTGTLSSAAVVVDLGDGASAVRWVDFDQPLSGLEVLQASGLDVTVAESSFGPAVCAIEGVGCPVDNCFCSPDLFWNYSFWDGGAWQSYPVGANDSIVEAHGAIEGWRWGAFTGAQAAPERAIAAATALEWMRTLQDSSTGGYGDSVAGAAEVLMAVGANNIAAATWRTEDETPSLAGFLRQAEQSHDLLSFCLLQLAVAVADGGGANRAASEFLANLFPGQTLLVLRLQNKFTNLILGHFNCSS